MNICLVSAMTSCSATSWSILRFQRTQTLPLMTSAFSCIIHERLICLFIYETMFTIRESRAISHSNDTEQKDNKWLEILDFQPKLLWRTPTKIHRERRRRRQQAVRKPQRTLLFTPKATSLTQRPQTRTIGRSGNAYSLQ